ncbi:MAG: hypothetical protein WD226_03130 [Planctomycetota bacterium]
MSVPAFLALGLFAAVSAGDPYGYAFVPDAEAEPTRWIATLAEPDPAQIDARQSAPFPTTLFHLTCDEYVDGQTLDAAGARRITVEARVVAGARGRGLFLEEPLELAASAPGDWSFFAWVRAENAGLAFRVGAYEATLSEGALTIRGGADEIVVPLAPGWNWIGLVRESLLGPSLRVGSAAGARRTAAARDEPAAATATLFGGVAFDDVRFEQASLSTLAFERLVAPPRAADGIHVVLRAAAGLRRERLWRVSGAPLLAGADLHAAARDHLRAVPEGLVWSPGQWRQDDTDAGPRPRTTHPTVGLGDGRVLIFGGETRDSHVGPQANDAEVWIYDARRRAWRRAKTNAGPSPRCHLGAAYSAARDEVVLTGGWCNTQDGSNEQYADVWSFDVANERWTRWETPARHGFSDAPVVHVPQLDACLVFLRWNVVALELARRGISVRPLPEAIDTEGRAAARTRGYSESYVHDPVRRRVLLFGGQVLGEDDVYHSELLAFEYETGTLRALGTEGPAPRVRSAFAHDSLRDRFVLFGGVHGQWSERFDDLWVFDPEREAWSERTAADAPSRRGGYFQMAFDAALDRFLLVGGRHSGELFLDEVWRLQLDDAARGHATWAFDPKLVAGDMQAFVEGDWTDEDHVRVRVKRDGEGPWLVTVEVQAERLSHPPLVRRVGFAGKETSPTPCSRRATVRFPLPAGR